MIAASPAAELRTKIRTLDLIELASIPRQASSPTVPETSIFNLTTAIDQFVTDVVLLRLCTFVSFEDNAFKSLTQCDTRSLRWKHWSRGEQMIKHEIHNHAGDRNVHPQRISPARDGAVAIKAFPQSADQRNEHHEVKLQWQEWCARSRW